MSRLSVDGDNYVSIIAREEGINSVSLSSRTTDQSIGLDELTYLAVKQLANVEEVFEIIISPRLNQQARLWSIPQPNIDLVERNWDIIGRYTVRYSYIDQSGWHSPNNYDVVINVTKMTDTEIYINGTVIIGGSHEVLFDTVEVYTEHIDSSIGTCLIVYFDAACDDIGYGQGAPNGLTFLSDRTVLRGWSLFPSVEMLRH